MQSIYSSYDDLSKHSDGTECQLHHSSTLLSGWHRKARHKLCKTSQSLLYVACMNSETLFFIADEKLLIGKLQGQSLVSCNLAIWARPAPQMEVEFTQHTHDSVIQHTRMRHWKLPLCHDRIEG